MMGLSSAGLDYGWAYASSYVRRESAAAGTAAVGRVSPAQTTPVEPVPEVAPVRRETPQWEVRLPEACQGADPVEMAVRGRIQYVDPDTLLQGEDAAARGTDAIQESKSAQEVMEEGECQTCKERKYQDGSNDPGVSYKNPTNIDPTQAASSVRGHEQEHVVREQAKAKREGREVVSQSVTLHTAICPECGKTYVSGGTTRTTTRAQQAAQAYQQPEEQPSLFQAVA